jgi:hypothetical protein
MTTRKSSDAGEPAVTDAPGLDQLQATRRIGGSQEQAEEKLTLAERHLRYGVSHPPRPPAPKVSVKDHPFNKPVEGLSKWGRSRLVKQPKAAELERPPDDPAPAREEGSMLLSDRYKREGVAAYGPKYAGVDAAAKSAQAVRSRKPKR